MRGAAMKVGQLLSMDSGQLLPPQLGELLARLREDAHAMPLGQVAAVLKDAWGTGWENQFSRFSFTPLAAASIGQVHEAVLKDGRRLAVKIQYPGIRESIDSDVDNVATLLRLSNLVPEAMDLQPLLDEAKSQLHAEADYLREASALERFGAHLARDSRFEVPAVVDSLTTQQVLSMRFLDGSPIESLVDASSSQRNAAASALLELAIREVFDWGLVQTDPNFANYLFAAESGRIQLLDFGATRDYAGTAQAGLGALLRACIEGSDVDIQAAAADVGYLQPADPAAYRDSVVALLRSATEPARAQGDYDFARSDLAARMRDIVTEMRLRERFARVPPPEILFLHRKLGGLYLLLSRLRARVPVATLISPLLPTGSGRGLAGELQQAV
jgi:predicted unusual protein kinase regulating ubiquinone biosynthesis (AarF/ABC1/UbiB family)